MGKEEIENFPLREMKSSLKGYFSHILTCKFIYDYLCYDEVSVVVLV